MFALFLASFMFLWTADNHEYLSRVTGADWEYVGVQNRTHGHQPDGSFALTMKSDGRRFILFKQKARLTERANSNRQPVQ